MLLAKPWPKEKHDPTGWYISEKLDGVRCLWDHTTRRFVSRLGNRFSAPEWFARDMPNDMTLDGELFAGRGSFDMTTSIVRTINSPEWHNIRYHVFDAPRLNVIFEERMDAIRAFFQKQRPEALGRTVEIVAQTVCTSRTHVTAMLAEVEKLGGEGLMLREARSMYVGARSSTLYKVKTFQDAEAKVVGYVGGKGKHTGATGSLLCRMASGKQFRCGTGLSDAQRAAPPAIGMIITYRFQELTKDGVPRFPSFVRERADLTDPQDFQA